MEQQVFQTIIHYISYNEKILFKNKNTQFLVCIRICSIIVNLKSDQLLQNISKVLLISQYYINVVGNVI